MPSLELLLRTPIQMHMGGFLRRHIVELLLGASDETRCNAGIRFSNTTGVQRKESGSRREDMWFLPSQIVSETQQELTF